MTESSGAKNVIVVIKGFGVCCPPLLGVNAVVEWYKGSGSEYLVFLLVGDEDGNLTGFVESCNGVDQTDIICV